MRGGAQTSNGKSLDFVDFEHIFTERMTNLSLEAEPLLLVLLFRCISVLLEKVGLTWLVMLQHDATWGNAELLEVGCDVEAGAGGGWGVSH